MEEGRMTRAIAIQGGITGRDATLIKAVVAGIMPEISDMLSSATVPLIAENKSLRDENADLAKRIAALEQRELRSEEHTSELQSLMRISYAVFCLKKKKHTSKHQHPKHIPPTQH